MVSSNLVSIVIPAKNGATTIAKCLESIAGQTHTNFEVLVIDSGSTDQTIAICSQFPFVKVISIAPSAFNHGTTRNLGVAKAKGEFVLLTVQDAYASTPDLIEKMLSHFLNDKEVAGVCGQQIVPHEPDKNPHEWFRPFSEPKPRVVQLNNENDINYISLKKLHSMCGWDNVNAMYRKSILEKVPFQEVTFGEDMLWAKTVILKGYKLVYDFNCRVYHYHHSTYDYTYKRMLTVLYYTYKNFGYLRKVKFTPLNYIYVIYRNFKYNADLFWILFNWRKMRAASKAYHDVKNYLKIGEMALDHYHQEICGLPPQGEQNFKKV